MFGVRDSRLAVPGMQLAEENRRLWLGRVCFTWFLFTGWPACAQVAETTLPDAVADAVPRPTDPGANEPFDPVAHRLIDLQKITIGRWAPEDPVSDLFTGEFSAGGGFLRLELAVEGLVNPPGNPDPFFFNPFRYGAHPVYGFVEIDMDNDVWTGGELHAPEYRYLGNVVRFGGNVLRPEFRDRVALDGAAFDDDFLTPPFVERHGEEFHLALLGWQFAPGDIQEMVGNGDGIFEAGETWNIRGPFFHRAHGFEEFSFVEGGMHAGEYAPESDLQFHHDANDDVTYLSLVFPLTNTGAGLMHDEPPEPANQDPTDHASVLEGLDDLQLSAFFLSIFPTGLPEEDIIIGWAERNPEDYLDPTSWSVTAILGTSYTQPDAAGVFYVWSDVYPNVVPGDVDGSGVWDGQDTQIIANYIAQNDRFDGVLDGQVTILSFAEDFSLYDVNHDGVVDHLDLIPIDRDGDGDTDGDVDLADFAVLQRCFTEAGGGSLACVAMDISGDERVDLDDVGPFIGSLTGPGGDH